MFLDCFSSISLPLSMYVHCNITSISFDFNVRISARIYFFLSNRIFFLSLISSNFRISSSFHFILHSLTV